MSIIKLLIGVMSGGTPVIVDPPPDPGGGEVSTAKNVQLIPNVPASPQDYQGFGFVTRTSDANIIRHFYRAGTGHLVGGKIYYQDYTISTGVWSSAVLLRTDTRNLEDVAGGYLENGNTVIFFTMSDNGFFGHTTHTEAAYYIVYDEDMNVLDGPIDYIGGTGGIAALDRGWAFGKVQYHGTPGAYSIDTVQLNVDTSPTGRKRFGILTTTDSWATFTYIKTGDSSDVGAPGVWTQHSENVSAYLGGGKMVKFARLDEGGAWHGFYSSDDGATWTGVGQTNIGYYGFAVKIYSVFVYNGLLNIIYQDRDSGMIAISKDNDPDDFFGTPTFNPSEMFYYNDTPASDYNGLGYPTVEHLGDGVFMVVWCREDQGDGTGGTAGVAKLLYTLTDFVTDPAGVPMAPPALTEFVAATSANGFVLDVTGYTNTPAQLQNIRYFSLDVSLNSGFSSFVTAKWQQPGLAAEPLQNIRIPATRIFITALTAATTYYVRMKAVNNAGESAYTSTSITTAAP